MEVWVVWIFWSLDMCVSIVGKSAGVLSGGRWALYTVDRLVFVAFGAHGSGRSRDSGLPMVWQFRWAKPFVVWRIGLLKKAVRLVRWATLQRARRAVRWSRWFSFLSWGASSGWMVFPAAMALRCFPRPAFVHIPALPMRPTTTMALQRVLTPGSLICQCSKHSKTNHWMNDESTL